MKSIFAIAKQTFWEGVRMRIVVVFLIVLGFIVLRLPFALRGDETLAGRLQNFLDYSLGAVGLLLSLTTVLFSASTLSQEFKNKSLHLIVTKPVSRLQILVGKWFGVNMLNIAMLLLCGVAIYGFAVFIKSKEATNRRDEIAINDAVWTARLAALPVEPPELAQKAVEYVDTRIKEGMMSAAGREAEIEARYRELTSAWRNVDPLYTQDYIFENLPEQKPGEFVQVKFRLRANPYPADDMCTVSWLFVDPDTGAWLHPEPIVMTERCAQLHQFLVKSDVVRNGKARLMMINSGLGDRSIYIDGDDGLQILYRVGSFEGNYAKTLLLILFRLGFLSALGVFFGTFVSFPVACFCGLTWYLICLGRPFWLEALGDGLGALSPADDPYGVAGVVLRPLMILVVKCFFPDFNAFSGGSNLVDGLVIQGGLVVRAALHTIVLGCALLFLIGGFIFHEREVAEVVV